MSHQRKETIVVVVLAAWCLGAVVGASLVDAQKRERHQQDKISGAEVSLKEGWQLLVLPGGCRFAVPGSWRANPDASEVLGRDGSSVSVRMFKITSWSAHKAQLKAAFGHVNAIHDDSERRLWLEIGDKASVQHYIDVLDGPRVCSALLQIHAATTPDASQITKTIADSLGPASEKWPPDFHK
jgi:hypothetical protein